MARNPRDLCQPRLGDARRHGGLRVPRDGPGRRGHKPEGRFCGTASAAPQYAKASNWLARPSHPKKKVDVFYLYPTSYFKTSPSEPVISTINDPGMVAGAKTSFAQQATAFTTVANVYAPYYRQADAVTVLSSPLATQNQIVGGTPAHDATAAFSYYIEHYNHGRPFILAGHSQGSNVLLFLLSGYLKQHPAVYRRMVAAYVIGYGVTRSYLAQNPQLKFATGANDTGVIVSWNTEAPGLTIKNPVVNPGSIAINPITWTTSERPASASRSLGSLLPNAAGKLVKVKHYADARVDKRRGTIVCSTCSVSLVRTGEARRLPQGHLPHPRLSVLLLRPAAECRKPDPALPQHPQTRHGGRGALDLQEPIDTPAGRTRRRLHPVLPFDRRSKGRPGSRGRRERFAREVRNVLG